MYRCDVEDKVLERNQWVEIPDGIIHVVAPEGARITASGHRIDGAEVQDFQVERSTDGNWQVSEGFEPRVGGVIILPVQVDNLDDSEPK